MVQMTQSMSQFLWRFHRDKLPLVAFGHLEVITQEIVDEYCAWCLTDEGKKYLKGGSEYDEDYARAIGVDQ